MCSYIQFGCNYIRLKINSFLTRLAHCIFTQKRLKMTTARQIVTEFLNFDGVNKAYVAEQLFGSRGKSSTSRLRKKHLGIENRHFTDAEIDRLLEIRKEFLTHLL